MTRHNLKKAESAGSAFFIFSALFFVLLVFAGCSKSSPSSNMTAATGIDNNRIFSSATGTQSKSELIVGFSQIGSESAWRTCNTESMKAAAEEAGIKMLYANAEQKQENQIKAIRSFIVYQVDVIVFVPIVQDGWDSVLREARDAGIPVLVIDRKINTADPSLIAGHFGTDGVEEGKKAANYLLEKYRHYPSNAQLNILELRGTAGSSIATERNQGFREIIDNDPRFNIVYSECGDFLRSRGSEIGQQILSETRYTHPHELWANDQKIDIVFSHNDAMTLGFVQKMREFGINPGKDVVVITVDAEQAAIDLLKDGGVNCVVECNPKIGPQAMELITELAKGNTIPRVTTVEERIFTEWDDVSDLPPRGY